MPAVESVEEKTQLIEDTDGTSGTFTLATSVDTTRTLVLASGLLRDSSASARNQRYAFSIDLTNSTTVTWQRTSSAYSGDCDLTIQVIQFDSASGVSVQRGQANSSADPKSVTLGTTVVETRSAIVGYAHLTTNQYDAKFLPVYKFTGSGTGFDIDFGVPPPASNYWVLEWQVIEFPVGTSVQHFFTDGLGQTETSVTETVSPAVDPAKTIVHTPGTRMETTGGSIRNIGRARAVRTINGAGDTLTVDWANVSGTTGDRQSATSLIEFDDGTNVESGTETVSSGNTTPTTQPSFTAMTNGSWWVGDNLQNMNQDSGSLGFDQSFQTKLDGTNDGLTLTRIATNTTVDVAWFAVDWAGAAGGPTPIDIPLGASSATGQVPLARWAAITAPAGSMSATGAAPTEALSAATVPAGAVSTGGAVPSLTLSAALVIQGQATAAGQIPFLRPSLLGVPAGVVTAGSSPPVLALSGVAVGQGSGSATGFAPSTGMDPIDVPGGTVTVTGTVPLVDPYLVPTGGVSASGWAPATALTGVATPGGLVTADGQVPEQVVGSVEIPGGAVVLSGLTPILRPSALWVGQGTITMGGSAPTLIQSGLGVPAGAVTTAGQVPDVFSDTIPVPLGAVLAAGAAPSTSTSQGEGDDPLACLRPVVSTVLKRVI